MAPPFNKIVVPDDVEIDIYEGRQEGSIWIQWLPLILSLLVLFILVKLIYKSFGSRSAPKARYIPFDMANSANEGIVVVDCTHPRLPTLSHHKGHNNPNGLRVRFL